MLEKTKPGSSISVGTCFFLQFFWLSQFLVCLLIFVGLVPTEWVYFKFWLCFSIPKALNKNDLKFFLNFDFSSQMILIIVLHFCIASGAKLSFCVICLVIAIFEKFPKKPIKPAHRFYVNNWVCKL